MEEEIGITESQLEAALKRWDDEAKSHRWGERNDPERFRDGAKMLIGFIKEAQR